MEYKIDKGIPLPAAVGGRKPKYPLLDMQIGDSFFVAKPPSVMYATTSYYSKKYGGEFTLAKWEENGVSGTRIWRVK